MREIKIKAKRLDNREWVKGSLIRSTVGIKEKAYIVDNFSSMSDYSVIGVDPSTVCQFTGLTDCKGKEIWEGDVVDREIYDFFKGIDIRKAIIEYIGCAFVAVTDGIPYSICSKYIKVIGNKFDNN